MNQQTQAGLHTTLIEHVTVAGGTHGNEITGIYAIEHWKSQAHKSFTSAALLANPRAAEAVRRYVDKDLNRCFSPEVLTNPALAKLWEVQRAKTIIEQLNDPTKPTDFVIDLHTTTANMGVTLIFEQANWLTYCILTHVQACMPDVHFMYEPVPASSYSQYLVGSAPQGLMIEVGPVAQGLLEPKTYEQTRRAVEETLKAIDFYNSTIAPDPSTWLKTVGEPNLDVYQSQTSVHYPNHEDYNADNSPAIKGPTALVHPLFQGKDYTLLQKGMPIFKEFSGTEHTYEGADCYPVFINEAAYYGANLAFTCTTRHPLDFNQAVPRHQRRTLAT